MKKALRILKRLTLLAALAALAPDLWAAGQAAYRRIAEEISRLAEKASVRTIAVLPFKAVSPSDNEGGEVVSERLITQLGRERRVQVVERSLLGKVMEEQKLQRTGMVDEAQVRNLGRVMGVDAVVSGSIIRAGEGLAELNTRLIHSEDARVLGSAVAEVPRDWGDEPSRRMDAPDPDPDIVTARPAPAAKREQTIVVPPPRLEMDFSPSLGMEFKAWWEAQPASAAGFEQGCGGWEDQATAFHRSTVGLKARFWAAKLLEPGFSRASLTKNPGSEIRNLQLRSEFYQRLKELYDSGTADPLSAAELRQLSATEKRVSDLSEECGR